MLHMYIIHTFRYVHAYMCMHAFTYLYIDTLTDKGMCAHTHKIHIQYKTHTHTHTHTLIYTLHAYINLPCKHILAKVNS